MSDNGGGTPPPPPPPPSTDFVIDDSLQGGTSQGTQIGGSFTNEGYRPQSGFNHILYEVPTVSEGYLEFQIKGMTNQSGKPEGDVGFCGIYDGRGHAEPIQYFDAFKQNFFRWNVHWRADKDAMKAVISAAAPTQERLNASFAQFPGPELEDRDWTAEPLGQGQNWNPNQWYTIKVEWKNKTFKVYIDGVQKWGASGPYDYAPVNQKIWIGSAPGYGDKYAALESNLVLEMLSCFANQIVVLLHHQQPMH